MQKQTRFLIARAMLATVFLLSALGKFLAPEAVGENLSRLFSVAPPIALWLAYLLATIEILLALWVLWGRRLHLLLPLPLLFAAVQIYSQIVQRDCGCFGRLPYLQKMPFAVHLFLLAGMFAAIGSLSDPLRIRFLSGSESRRGKLALVSIPILSSALLWPLLVPGGSPRRATQELPMVDLEAVWQATEDSSTVLLDARSTFQFELGHIPGAVNVPADSNSLSDHLRRLQLADRKIIVYCAGIHCDAAERLAKRLRDLGFRNVYLFPGGWEEWISQE